MRRLLTACIVVKFKAISFAKKILSNLKSIYNNDWPFKSFLINLTASLLSAGIVAFVLIYIFKVPSFELSATYIKVDNDANYLNFEIINNKKYISYNREEISFVLLFPDNLINNKKIYLVDSNIGKHEFILDENLQKTYINSRLYSVVKAVIKMPVFPDSKTSFLVIEGDFNSLEKEKIYYTFDTPYGFFPNGYTSKERINAKNLPFYLINFSLYEKREKVTKKVF
ncbi:MAG: hypothetical protein R3B60_04010 [Candidatus Paceibacterota bacterium]